MSKSHWWYHFLDALSDAMIGLLVLCIVIAILFVMFVIVTAAIMVVR